MVTKQIVEMNWVPAPENCWSILMYFLHGRYLFLGVLLFAQVNFLKYCNVKLL